MYTVGDNESTTGDKLSCDNLQVLRVDDGFA